MRSLLRRTIGRGRRVLGELRGAMQARQLSIRPRPIRAPVELESLLLQPALVVVAHPDDEVIAASALLGRVPRAGVITVTNGAPRNEDFARGAGFDNWLDYAIARRREAEAALTLLDREFELTRCLEISDQDAALNMVAVTRHLVHHLKNFPQVITHAYEGGHPDHDSTAFCVHAACALLARDGGVAPLIVEVPLYNSPHGTILPQTFLSHLDAGAVVSVQLPPAEQERKRQMYACHVTQGRLLEQYFHVREESYRVAPRYHFAAPPHPGKLCYETPLHPVNGRIWRREARKAMRVLGLLHVLA